MLIALVLLLPWRAAAYQRGDVVSTLVRTQHGGWRTPWTEVMRSEMPRFREDTVIRVQPPVPSEVLGDAYRPDEPFKLSLAFSESRFVVPWVKTQTQGGGSRHVLKYLQLTFFYSGSDILQVKWTGDCTCPRSRPPTVRAPTLFFRAQYTRCGC